MPDSSAMVATASHYRPMRPVREELLSPSAYLRVMGSQKGNIAHAQAIPPAPGKRGYGKIRVQYRMPVIRSHGA